MFTCDVSFFSEKPVHVDEDRCNDTEECPEAYHDNVANSFVQGRCAAEEVFIFPVFIEDRRDFPKKAFVRHGDGIFFNLEAIS